MLKTNMGGIDRLLRIVLGIVLLALVFTEAIGAWGWIGVIPLATGLVGSCPLYSVFGFRTCRLDRT